MHTWKFFIQLGKVNDIILSRLLIISCYYRYYNASCVQYHQFLPPCKDHNAIPYIRYTSIKPSSLSYKWHFLCIVSFVLTLGSYIKALLCVINVAISILSVDFYISIFPKWYFCILNLFEYCYSHFLCCWVIQVLYFVRNCKGTFGHSTDIYRRYKFINRWLTTPKYWTP